MNSICNGEVGGESRVRRCAMMHEASGLRRQRSRALDSFALVREFRFRGCSACRPYKTKKSRSWQCVRDLKDFDITEASPKKGPSSNASITFFACCACGLRWDLAGPSLDLEIPPFAHLRQNTLQKANMVRRRELRRSYIGGTVFKLVCGRQTAICFYLLVPWRVPQYFICTLRNYPKELEMYALGLSIYNTIPNRTCPSIPFLPCPVPLSSSFRFEP